MAAKPYYVFLASIAGQVDHEKGLISGVSVITIGEARGHDMFVDQLTLEQVKACAQSYKKGLKVKMDHYSGIQDIVAFLRNFRVEGQKLIADMQLLRTHPKREYVLELAEEIDDNFGLSIAFTGDHQVVDKVRYARCSEIYSADLVTEPAANAGGLFEKPKEAQVDTQNKSEPSNYFLQMTPEQFSEALNKALEPINKRFEDLEKKVSPPKVEEKKEEVNTDELEAKILAKVLAKSASAPLPPSPAPEEEKKEVKKTFSDVLTEQAAILSSQAKAMSFCVKQFPELYKEYREKNLGVIYVEPKP